MNDGVNNRRDKPGLAPEMGGSDRMIVFSGHRIESRDLFADTREIKIGHGEDVYRLRLTAQNKLILTK